MRKTKKLPEIEGCPFRAGDIVQKKSYCGYLNFTTPFVVTSVRKIPNIDDRSEGYGKDVKACAYWVYGTALDGSEFKTETGNGPNVGAIWVGFVELHPFLGPAKRAVMEHGDLRSD